MLDVAQVGRRIHERRRTQGLTQEQLGAELSVSPQAVSKWEKGESAPDIGILPALCHTLGISADTLLGISGGPGAEQLAGELTGRLRHMRPAERERALFAAVKLLLGTDELDDAGGLPPANSVICLFEQGSLAGLRLILKNGFAGLVRTPHPGRPGLPGGRPCAHGRSATGVGARVRRQPRPVCRRPTGCAHQAA